MAATASDEMETAIIADVSADGRTLTLESPVAWLHAGERFSAGGRSVDMFAEVALLTQNVVVRGDDDLWNEVDLFGGVIMLHTAAGLPVVGRIANVELVRMGQGYNYGHSPLVFDQVGDASASYIRAVSLHEAYNRGFVLHGVTRLTVSGCVAVGVRGHTYFIAEDGVETDNVVADCLGMGTVASDSSLNTELVPAVFWISNPANTVVGCAAVGGVSEGFAFVPEAGAVGAAAAGGRLPQAHAAHVL